MRQLRLENPNMRGTDVSDWQTFLIDQKLSTGRANGVFDAPTASSTRAFQSKAGMTADGVVGPFTLARALDDGLTSTGGPLIPGIDAGVNCASFAAAIAKAGLRFVARYYSLTSSKALTPREAQALSAAGLKIVTIYQDINNNLKYFTAAIGAAQAKNALAQAAAALQPVNSAIFFATDFNPSADQVRGPVMEYFHAVHDAFSGSPFSVGVYGSGTTCRMIRDAGFAKYTWLSQSTGYSEYRNFLPQADVVQAAPSRDLIAGNLNVDDDIAQSADFGAFQLP